MRSNTTKMHTVFVLLPAHAHISAHLAIFQFAKDGNIKRPPNFIHMGRVANLQKHLPYKFVKLIKVHLGFEVKIHHDQVGIRYLKCYIVHCTGPFNSVR